jgi:YggT family protein
MFAFGNLVAALAEVVNILLTIVYWLIIIRALVSWVNPDPFNPFVQFLNRTTEPILEPIRRLMPPLAIDVSPILAIIAIVFLKRFLVATMLDLAARLH